MAAPVLPQPALGGDIPNAGYPTPGQGLVLDTNGQLPDAVKRTTVFAVYDTTLAAAAASLNASNIPSIYAHLLIVAYLRTDRAANAIDKLGVRFNADTGANYNSLIGELTSTGAGSSGGFTGETSALAGTVPGATAAASAFSPVSITVPNYAAAVAHKAANYQSSSIQDDTVANWFVDIGGFRWKSAAPISQVTLISRNGANFVAGSRMTIYGTGAGF